LYLCLNIKLTLKLLSNILTISAIVICTHAIAGGNVETKTLTDGTTIDRISSQLYKVTSYYKNGQVKEIGHYKNGERHGSFTRYSESGLKEASAFFYSDKKDGLWIFYDQHGNVKHYVFFHKNDIIRLENEGMVTNSEF